METNNNASAVGKNIIKMGIMMVEVPKPVTVPIALAKNMREIIKASSTKNF